MFGVRVMEEINKKKGGVWGHVKKVNGAFLLGLPSV